MSTFCAGLVNERPTNSENNSVYCTQGRCGSTQNQAGKGVTEREDMEKAFPPVLSNLNLVVVAGNGPVEKSAGREARRPPRPALLLLYWLLSSNIFFLIGHNRDFM